MPELDTAQAKIVFDNISEKINIGDYETYLSKMQDPANRELFFKSVSEKVNIGDDYNEFEKNITKSTPTATANNLAGATASGSVVPKTETPSKPTTTGYSENITNFVTAYQKDPKTAMQELPTWLLFTSTEEIKATPLNSMVKESLIKAKKNLELSNDFGEPILQAGVMRGVEVKAKQKEKDVPTLSFASIYKEAEKQKEDITIPYSSQEQTVTPLPKEDILKANLTLINSYLSKGDVDSYNTALKMTKIQAEKYPYLKSYANRLESYIKRKEGDFEGAAKSYDNIEDDSKTISDFNISAYSKVKAGKVEEANEDIDKAIERGNPSDINDIDDLIYSWQLKGNMAYNAGSTELMEQASSKIKELKYAKDRATKDNVFTIFTKTPLTQEEWDKQYNIIQKNIITSPILGPALGAAEALGMALQGVYEMSTPPPKDKVYTKEEYDKEKNDRVLLGYSKALNGMVSTAFNTFPSIYLFNVGMGAISEIEKEKRNSVYDKIREQTYIPLEVLERAKEEEGFIDTVSKWIFAPLTNILKETGVYDKMNETQRNFIGLGDVVTTIVGMGLAHKGVSALKKNIPPAIEDYIKSQDKFTTDKGVQEFREREAKVEATAEKIKNIDIDKATLDAIMEMKKEAEPITAVMDKINKGEAITEAEGKLVVDFIDQTMKDPEFIIKTFKKEPIQVEKKVDNSVQGNLNRLRTEEANIVNKKEYAGIDDLYKAEELGNEIAALNEKVNKVIAEKTKAVQEQIDLLKQERKDLYNKDGISNEELLVNSEIEADINTRLQPLLKEKQNIINEVYKLDITELDNILKPKEEAKPITIDEQIAKTEDIINKEGVTETTPLVENEINKIDNSVISKEQPIVEVKPIRQLGTGANVYYESNKYRVNDFTDGDILLNVGAKDMEVPLANISFKDVNEAVFVAKKLQEIYPTGVPEAVLIDRVIDDFKKEYKVNKATEVKPTKTEELINNVTDINGLIEINGEEVHISIPDDVVKAANEMSQAERARAEGILREQANDKYNEEIKKSIAEEQVGEIPLTETTYNFESVKQENIDRYDYYTKEVDGVTKYFKKEKSAESQQKIEQIKDIPLSAFENKIEGRFLDKKQAGELQKEIESNYIDGDMMEHFSGKKQDIRMNLFNYDHPLAQKNVNGVDLRIAEGLIRNKRRTYLLYADGNIIGEFYSVKDIKSIIKHIEDNLVKSIPSKAQTVTPIEAGKKEVITDTTNELIINNLNPTGGLLVDYNPKARMTAKLADNITTLDKTMGGSPDDIITIYRGATKKQKKIVPGDYITTNKELAKSYTGDGNVLEMEVRKGDILDDINEPLGEEYIYRPKEYEKTRTETQEAVTKPIEEKLELNTNVKNVDIKDVNTDIKRFQNRKGEYSKQSVKNITENYDENKFDPIVSWKDPKDGKIYVLSGHSRLEALKRIGKEKIPTRIFEGTEAQAKQYAIDSNVLGTQETLTERANKYSKMREEGKTEVEIDKEADIEGANKQRVIDYSYLNKKGKTIASLKAFEESGVSENVDNIQKVAQWIGGARRIFKELTNAHENEMYDYLINKNKIGTKEGQISNKTQFFDLINKRINGLAEFKSNEPLNFEHRVGKGTLELEVSKEIKDLKAQQTKISADIKKAQKTIKDKELRDKTISNLTKEFLDVNKKIGDAEKKLEIAKEGDKKQISIFDELNKEVENGTITKETIERFEQRTENEVAKSESTIEALESKEKVATEKESIEKLESEVDKEITKVTEQQPTTPATTPATTPKVEVVKKSSTEIAKEITTKEKIAEANAIIGDELSKLMNQIGVKKGLLPEDKVNIKRLVTAMAEKTGLEIKLVIENMKAYLEKEYPSSKKEINDVLDEVIKEQEKTTTENKKQTALEERTASSERAEEVRRLEEEFNEEVKNMTNEQYEKFKEFKELANTVPETKMIEEYATKGSIEFHQKDTPEGPQEYFKMTYMKSLAHSVEAINKARELWGDNFVKKTLDYINTNHVPVQNKTLLYIGLENALRLEKINFPERAELITKQQNLVWEQSQRYAKTLGQGTAFQNLRAFAEANFEIEKATNEMFTSSELKSKKIIEQRISSNIKDIQKEYEETIETQELEGITDTKTTEVTEVTPAIREMIKKGVETEINKIYEKIPSERKQKIDTYINALSDIQTRLRSRTYEASIGIPVAIIDMGISAIKLALKGGVLLADAIEIGIAKIKELNNGKWEKEEQFRKDITEEFKNKKINVNEKIKTEKPKVEKVKKTAEEILKEKLERKRASIEKLKEDIKLKRNELKARDVPESDNIQYQILVKEQRALRQLIEKYIPKDEVLRSEKQTEVISKELLSDIDKINKEIIELEKSLKEKGEPIIDNEKVNNLKIAKKARLELINIVDPTKTDLVKNAMIDAGLTKDKVVKTKDGQKTIKLLDWEKLAGAEGSPELIRQRTEKYLTDKGYSKSDIIRVQDALENQYTALRDQIITKGYNKLESLNKVKMTSEQKTASRKLAEMYNYGLFDRQADTYNYLMNKLLGMDDLSQATFFKTKEIGKVLAELYDTKIFHQDKVDPSSLNHVLNIIDNNLRKILRAELKNKKGFGAVNVRVARSVQSLMELGQRMALNTVKQIIQNPLSGKIQLELAKLEGIFDKTDTKALKEKRKAIKYAILSDIITKGGQYYGKVTSQFLNKGMLDDYINKASDSRIYHMGMSVLLNRAGLEAADAYFKYQITDMYFIQNLVKILTDKTNPNRMRKRDALEFVSERLTGENFKTAESKAIELIKYANKNKPKNQKLIPENKETVLRLADDLVRESLLTGGKITLDQLKAAYDMAYKNAGFDLGHEANNLISWGIRNVSGDLEAAVNKSIKEGRMREATMGIYTSILFRNMMNPYVGGGTNWTVLLAEKAAINPISLVTLIERNARRRKLDVSDGASVKDMREALLRNRNAKSTNTRILTGNIAALLTYIAAKGTGLDDNFEKWISKNEWLRKYVELFTPEWLILYCHITEKEGLAKYLEKTFNSNPSYDKLDGIIKGLSDISSKGDGTKLGVALGQFFNAPTPWRLARDIESIYRGATGKPQRARSPKPKGVVEGFFIYGMINYLKQKEGTYKEQAIIDEVEKKGALVGNEEAKRIDYIERANNRNIEIPKNATMEEAEQIVKTYNFDKRVENYNNKLKLYTKEELEKKGIYEPTETGKSGGSKSTKGKGKLSKSKKSKK